MIKNQQIEIKEKKYPVLNDELAKEFGFESAEDFKNKMLTYYIELYDDEEIKSKLKKSVKPLQLMRYLQVLGAYGLRGLVQRKAHFIASIEKGIQNLTEFASNWEEMQNYPELQNVIEQLNSAETKLKIERIINH